MGSGKVFTQVEKSVADEKINRVPDAACCFRAHDLSFVESFRESSSAADPYLLQIE